jgi:uncharacterized protein DUF11
MMRRSTATPSRAFLISVLVATTIGVALPVTAGSEVVPTADLAVVSNSASVRHAKVGDEITFTIIATNNGPDAVDFNVMWSSEQLQLVEETCDRGISADTPACEYGTVAPGVTLTTTVIAQLLNTDSKYATGMGCMVEQPALITDPDPQNNCATATVKIVGRR